MPNLDNKNNQLPSNFKVIGVMSGTSLDGLDVAYCTFNKKDNKWTYTIDEAATFQYDNEIREILSRAYNCSGRELTIIDFQFGSFIGKKVDKFITSKKLKPDFIASHGHTIFHDPKNGYTLQIGKGAAIAAKTKIPCICDFRTSDICRDGQGAPLVPIGDKLLFSDLDICLNLGGFSNISFDKNEVRLAFDVSPCNIALNHFSNKLGKEFDLNGELGKLGKINYDLLRELNTLPFYHLESPKSLGKEWFDEVFLPSFSNYNINITDILATIYEHIAEQIVSNTNGIKGEKILISGGGAKNQFLIQLIKSKSNKTIVIPDILTIDFKEALIFAFLGVLYMIKQPGALKSVTGANADSISGCMYY